MIDLQYTKGQIIRHFRDAESVLLKENPACIPELIKATLTVLRLIDKQIEAEK